MKKLALKLVFTIALITGIIGVFSSHVYADPFYDENEYFKYSIEDGKVTITKGKDDKLSGKLTIPSDIGGYPVTAIGIGAFYNFENITELEIPNTVESIGGGSFEGCKNLTGDLIIPDSVVSIGANAFRVCKGFNGNLVIGNGVQMIGDSAFYQCAFEGTLTLGENVQTIGKDAFSGCSKMTGELSLPASLVTIGEYAFSGCSSLKGALTIPQNVTSIGQRAFASCTGFDGGLTLPANLTTIGDFAFYSCKNLSGNLVIPNNVTKIGGQAFYGCQKLTGNLIIPEKVEYIGDHSFQDCSGFTGDLIIPDSVLYVGTHAFNGCAGFNGTLTIGKNVNSIGAFSFSQCSGLTGDLIIPDSVETIGNNAFQGCSKLDGNLKLSSSLTEIANDAFHGCEEITGELSIPKGVTKIGRSAFTGCAKLTKLTIPDTVTVINESAFTGCKGLSGDLFIPDSVTTIEYIAFSNCSGLTGCYIPDSVTTFGNNIFSNCQFLYASVPYGMEDTTISMKLKLGQSCTVERRPYKLTYTCNEAGKAIVTGIEGEATDGLIIPRRYGENYVTEIGSSAFTNKSVKGELVIPDSVTTIGSSAFTGCKDLIGTLIIPDSVSSIGQSAFWNCSGFTGLSIGNGIKKIENSTFEGCVGLKGDLVIPKGVTEIGNQAFWGCENFTGNLVIPDSVDIIGNEAFFKGSFTGKLIIPDGVEAIGNGAFKSCSGFDKNDLIIPESVKSIGSGAFEGTPFASISVPFEEKDFDSSVFTGYNGIEKYKGDYFVYFDKNNEEASGEMQRVLVKNQVYTLPDSDFGAPECQIFGGWSYTETGDKISETQITLTEDTKLYAVWNKMKCLISFEGGEDVTGTAPDSINADQKGTVKLPKNTFNKKGFKFIGWTDGSNTYAEDFAFTVPKQDEISFTAKWDKLPIYKITFAGGADATGTAPTEMEGNENDIVKLPQNTFTKTGYKFAGWSDGSKTYKEGAEYTIPAKAVTLTAEWEAVEYTITFEGGEQATGSAPEDIKGHMNDKVTLPQNTFTKKGYKFAGWTDGINTYMEGIDYTVPAQNVKMTAKWKKLPVYKITFAGGSGATGTAPAAMSGNEKDKVTLPKNTFTKKGYKFVGWTDGSKTYKAGATYTIPAKNVKLTAKWQKNELTKRERIEQFAERMYTKAFGRNAEPDGLKYWADRLEKQIDDGANMAYGFITSDEFKARKLSDDQFIETMYQTFFGRTADSTGKTYWMNQIKSGASRETVLAGFVKSEEFGKLCSDAGIERGLILEDGKPVNAGIYQFVKRQYTCCLQRDGERDGMDYWATKIANREVSAVDAAKEFFFSTEFESKGLSDKQFVERLYETFLGRPFDEVGYAYWNDKMSKGETRKEVIDEFAASEEFKGILRGFGL